MRRNVYLNGMKAMVVITYPRTTSGEGVMLYRYLYSLVEKEVNFSFCALMHSH